jgi:hypothetical protein
MWIGESIQDWTIGVNFDAESLIQAKLAQGKQFAGE